MRRKFEKQNRFSGAMHFQNASHRPHKMTFGQISKNKERKYIAMQNPSIYKPILILTGAAILLTMMYFAADVFAPIFQAIFIATLLTPIYKWLKRRVPGGLALLLTLGFVVLVALFLALLIGKSLTTLKTSLSSYNDQFAQRQEELAAQVETLQQTGDFTQVLSAVDADKLQEVLSLFLTAIVDIFSKAFLIFVMIVFILVEGPLFFRRMKAAFGEDHFLPQNVVILERMMVGYFGLRALVNLFTATTTGLMLWFFGVDYPALWAVLIFFLSFIPYVGAILAMIPPVLLAYAESGLGAAIVIVLLSMVINSVAENLVAPMVMGKGLALSPTVVFLSFLFWMYILGGPGALLAVPLTMAMTQFMSSFEETRGIAALLVTSSDPKAKR
jgi:AI-2 transport protein TqsA